MGDKIEFSKPDAKSADQIEEAFMAEVTEVIGRYWKGGMTARWQAACLSELAGGLMNPEYEVL